MPVVLIDEVKSSLEWELSTQEVKIATWAIGALTVEAKHLSGGVWTDPPTIIGVQIVKAVGRWLRNPDGLSQDRIGEAVIGRPYGSPEIHSSPTFTDYEMKIIRESQSRRNGFGSIQTTGLVLGPRGGYGDSWSTMDLP